MRRSTISTMAAIGGTTVGLAGVAAAIAARRMRTSSRPERIIHLRADQLPYEPIMEGVSMAVLRGRPKDGRHAVLTRFQPGFRIPRHIHTADVAIMVLSGAYVYGLDGEEVRVEPGSYLVIPGGTPHWSGGDAKEGALFFQEADEPFDLKVLD